MTTVPKPSSPASGLTLKWDAWNRLVEVKSGATTVGKYRYDGLGRRIDRAVFPPIGFRHDYTYYNASWQMLEIRPAVGGTQHPETLQPKYQYVWSARYIDAPVLQDSNSDQDGLCDDGRYYYLSDANFNVTTLTDSSGDALEHYVYDPYGHVTAYEPDWSDVQAGFPYGFRFGYTGREYDLESGLYNYRNRYYHAQLGRFVSRDTIWHHGEGENFYVYAGGAPVNTLDPSGNVGCPSYKAAELSDKQKKARDEAMKDCIGSWRSGTEEEAFAYVECDGKGNMRIKELTQKEIESRLKQTQPVLAKCWSICGLNECTACHEQQHIEQIEKVGGNVCTCEQGPRKGGVVGITGKDGAKATESKCHEIGECYALLVELNCLQKMAKRKATTRCTVDGRRYKCADILGSFRQQKLSNAGTKYNCAQHRVDLPKE